MLRYAITSGNLQPTQLDGIRGTRVYPTYDALLQQARNLSQSGVECLQLREKSLSPAELLALARALVEVLQGSPTRLLINTRLDVALAARASGVHLPSLPGSLTTTQVRRLYRAQALPEPVISKACHSRCEVLQARAESATLVLFSPIFGKGGSPPAGLKALAEACEAAYPIPVLALGGVTNERISACVQAGAAGVAGIRLFQ